MSDEINVGQFASFTDPIANTVIVSGIRIEHVPGLIRPGRYPPRLMPSLLHEAMHFDCFSTPVGQALAALYLRAWKHAVLERDAGGGDDGYDGVVDLVRYRVALEILSPFLEGMALFAEFDSVPCGSSVTTTPTFLAGFMFSESFGGIKENQTIADLALRNLLLARCQSFYTSRKENLIVQPFTSTKGGYMPGYYLVKNLQHILLGRTGYGNLLDGDLFLYCLKAKVLGDLRLARLIVDPELDLMFSTSRDAVERDAVNAVLMRIQALISELPMTIDESYIRRIEETVGRDRRWTYAELQPDENLATLEEDCRVRQRALDDLCDASEEELRVLEHALSNPGDDAGESLRMDNGFVAICQAALNYRHLLCLASFDTTVRVTEHGMCNIGAFAEVDGYTFPHVSMHALPGTLPCEGQGTFEFYLDCRDLKNIYYRVAVGERIVACGKLNDEGDDNVLSLLSRTMSGRALFSFHQQMEQDLRSVYGSDDTWASIIAHYGDQPLVDQIYLNYSKRIIDLHAGRFDPRLRTGGILALANDDSEFLQHYAALSLTSSLYLEDDALNRYGELLGIDTEAFQHSAEQWFSRTGFPLTTRRGSSTIFHI